MIPKRKTIRRLFVDPGSKSCGWALFDNETLMQTGTIASHARDVGDADCFRRLSLIMGHFGILANETFDEVHLEQLVRNTHYYTHWSVGAIGSLLAASGAETRADVPIRLWQLYAGWKKKTPNPQLPSDVEVTLPELKKLQAREDLASVDELAAAAMGFYYVREGVKARRKK